MMVALLLALAVAALADPCVFQAGQVYTAQAALECWQTIPFNPAVADNTVDSLLKGMELYAFLVRASGGAAPCIAAPLTVLLCSAAGHCRGAAEAA